MERVLSLQNLSAFASDMDYEFDSNLSVNCSAASTGAAQFNSTCSLNACRDGEDEAMGW